MREPRGLTGQQAATLRRGYTGDFPGSFGGPHLGPQQAIAQVPIRRLEPSAWGMVDPPWPVNLLTRWASLLTFRKCRMQSIMATFSVAFVGGVSPFHRGWPSPQLQRTL